MPSAIVRVLYSRVPESVTEEDCRLLKSMLPEQLLLPVAAYQHLKNACSSLLGMVLLQQILPHFGFNPDLLQNMTRNPFGKPLLPGLYFNYSHAGETVICAASTDCSVGIDIEKIQTLAWDEYYDCFSENEQEELKSAASPEKLFFELWTKKESLIKADGRGMSIEMQNAITKNHLGYIKDKKLEQELYPIITYPGYTTHLCTNPGADIILSEYSVFEKKPAK